MITVKDVKNGARLPDPIYASQPYIVLGNRGDSIGAIMTTGTLEEIKTLGYGGYYDDCPVEVRQHDLHLNDNTKLPAYDYQI